MHPRMILDIFKPEFPRRTKQERNIVEWLDVVWVKIEPVEISKVKDKYSPYSILVWFAVVDILYSIEAKEQQVRVLARLCEWRIWRQLERRGIGDHKKHLSPPFYTVSIHTRDPTGGYITFRSFISCRIERRHSRTVKGTEYGRPCCVTRYQGLLLSLNVER